MRITDPQLKGADGKSAPAGGVVMAWNTDNTDVNNADFHLNPFLFAFENPHHLRLVERMMA